VIARLPRRSLSAAARDKLASPTFCSASSILPPSNLRSPLHTILCHILRILLHWLVGPRPRLYLTSGRSFWLEYILCKSLNFVVGKRTISSLVCEGFAILSLFCPLACTSPLFQGGRCLPSSPLISAWSWLCFPPRGVLVISETPQPPLSRSLFQFPECVTETPPYLPYELRSFHPVSFGSPWRGQEQRATLGAPVATTSTPTSRSYLFISLSYLVYRFISSSQLTLLPLLSLLTTPV
jgi:hypothetical protein